MSARAEHPGSGSIGDRRGFNPHIHGARGLFSGLVFVHHVANSKLPTFDLFSGPIAGFVTQSFQFGVELFFGISGIVIIGALERSPNWRAFIWDRLTRILPVLWTTIAVLTAVFLAADQRLPSLENYLKNLIPTPPPFGGRLLNPAAWSLDYELIFYLIAGLAWAVRRHRPVFWTICAAGFVYMLFYPRAVLMLAGVLIARGLVTERLLFGVGRYAGTCVALFLLCWYGTTQLQGSDPLRPIVLGPAFLPFETWLGSLPLMALGALFGTLALAGISAGRGMLSRFLTSRAMLWLGTISYSFYLWHPLIVSGAKRALVLAGLVDRLGPATQLVLFVVALPPSLLIAAASQHYIEGRFTRWLRSLGPRKPAGPVDRFLAATGQTDAMPPSPALGPAPSR